MTGHLSRSHKTCPKALLHLFEFLDPLIQTIHVPHNCFRVIYTFSLPHVPIFAKASCSYVHLTVFFYKFRPCRRCFLVVPCFLVSQDQPLHPYVLLRVAKIIVSSNQAKGSYSAGVKQLAGLTVEYYLDLHSSTLSAVCIFFVWVGWDFWPSCFGRTLQNAKRNIVQLWCVGISLVRLSLKESWVGATWAMLRSMT